MTPRPGWRETLGWGAVAVLATLLLLRFRGAAGEAHIALAYLLVVLGASARGGRRLGMPLAFACFLAFNFFFLRPFYTFVVHNPLDWLVLIAFLVTSAVATQLLHRAQHQADEAARRTREVDRMATLGAEALKAARADEAVAAIARVVRAELGMSVCEIYLTDAETGHARLMARDRDPSAAEAAEADAPDSAARLVLAGDARTLLLPLRVRDRTVGMLRAESPRILQLTSAERRFAEALGYYAALAVDRARLAAEAEHAQALREADRLKDALLASVSHDLRTPLTTIQAVAEEIAAAGDERAGVVVEEAVRLNRFVSDLLDFSRLKAGAEPVRAELVAAEDVLGVALQRLGGPGAERVDARLPDGALLVGRMDFSHALRALVNLVENALKYSPPSSRVEVAAEARPGWIAFIVADRGPGIAPDDRERVFEPFHRADQGGSAGTGLGLAIARRSAELQGGELGYQPRPGGGSIFTLLLPAAGEDELAAMSL